MVYGSRSHAAAAMIAIQRTQLGKFMRAIAEAPNMLATNGLQVNLVKVVVFSVSSFFAAISGGLMLTQATQVAGQGFTPLVSLLLVEVLAVSRDLSHLVAADRRRALHAPGGVLGLVPTQDRQRCCSASSQSPLVSSSRTGRASPTGSVGHGVEGRRPHRPQSGADAGASGQPGHHGDGRMTLAEGIRVDQVRIVYGHVVAIEAVTFDAPMGRITGLIGPNGAGKTSVFNACCGLLAPDKGTITLRGTVVNNRGPAARARMGLGRTFQIVELCNAMTVRENVALGTQARMAGGSPLKAFSLDAPQPGGSRRPHGAIERCGLTSFADRSVSGLSTGQRRLVELARVVAGGFDMLLLDEPSSGLDDAETARFGEVLEGAVAQRRSGCCWSSTTWPSSCTCASTSTSSTSAAIFDGSPRREVRASARAGGVPRAGRGGGRLMRLELPGSRWVRRR